jgi:outer membrane protein OmpA-like peptidoglycan-associated protein
LNAKSVVLAGHADRAGASDYNLRLSQRRVAAVRAAIQRAGVDVRFDISSFGEQRPAVQTADGVREARNRRVEVRIVP